MAKEHKDGKDGMKAEHHSKHGKHHGMGKKEHGFGAKLGKGSHKSGLEGPHHK